MAAPFPFPPGYENYKFIFGRAPSLPIAQRIVWDGANGVYNGILASESPLSIVSDSADDAPGQTGATEVTFFYQGEDGIERIGVSALNGLTPVDIPSGAVLADVSYKAYVSGTQDSDIGGANHGTIKCYQTGTPANILWQINPGEGETLMCFYRVPLNKYLEIYQIDAFPSGTKAAVMRLMAKLGKNFPWRAQAIGDSLSTPIPIRSRFPIPARPGVYLAITATPEQADTPVSAMILGILKDYPGEEFYS